MSVGLVLVFLYVENRMAEFRLQKALAQSAKVTGEAEQKRRAGEGEQATVREQQKYDALPMEAKNRIQYARLVEAAQQALGRRMSVRATGDNFETIELSSGLICETCNTLDAAREVVGSSEILRQLKSLKFKRVSITNPDSGFAESYVVQ